MAQSQRVACYFCFSMSARQVVTWIFHRAHNTRGSEGGYVAWHPELRLPCSCYALPRPWHVGHGTGIWPLPLYGTQMRAKGSFLLGSYPSPPHEPQVRKPAPPEPRHVGQVAEFE